MYSTCSIHEEENEAVVEALLGKVKGWTLRRVLPNWKRRGFKKFLHGLSRAIDTRTPGIHFSTAGDFCVRTIPEKDVTNGFFVACFERVTGSAASSFKPLFSDGTDGATGAPREVAKRKLNETVSFATEETSVPQLQQKCRKRRKRNKRGISRYIFPNPSFV